MTLFTFGKHVIIYIIHYLVLILSWTLIHLISTVHVHVLNMHAQRAYVCTDVCIGYILQSHSLWGHYRNNYHHYADRFIEYSLHFAYATRVDASNSFT